jgi:hypothetical protein
MAGSKYGFWPADVSNDRVRYLPIKASQTLTRGDAVIISSGQIAIAVAGSAELVGVIARDCASLTAATPVPVYHRDDHEFECMANADSSSVVLGGEYDLIGATGAMLLNVGASSTDVFVAVRGNPEDTLTDAYARWIVKINKHALSDQS